MSIQYVSEFSIGTIWFRLLLSALVGFLIGVNRERKKRGAGTRTHALVCISACLIMMTNEFLAFIYPEFIGDISRLGSQFISGMGFIGAGTIIVTKYNHVRGLTTAGSLLTTACLGLAIGIGFIDAAIAATLIVLFVLIIVERTDRFLKSRSMVHDYLIVFCDTEGLSVFLDKVQTAGIRISNIEINHVSKEEGPIVYITLETKTDLMDFMLKVQDEIRIKMLNEIQ